VSKPKDFVSISFRLRWGNQRHGGGVKHCRYEPKEGEKSIEGLNMIFKEFLDNVIWYTEFIDWAKKHGDG